MHRPVGWAQQRLGETTDGVVLQKENSEQETRSYHKVMVVHVQDEVLAHDSQTNECNICSVGRRAMVTQSGERLLHA